MSESSAGKTINLDSMSLEELHQLQQREENRLQMLTNQFAQLRQVAARIQASKRAVTDLEQATEATPVMVPLTESVYVPGKLQDPNQLLVELGTGYYCEKTTSETNDILDRKLKLVDSNSSTVSEAVGVTRQNLQTIQMTMQGKLLEIRAKQEGMRYKAVAEGNN